MKKTNIQHKTTDILTDKIEFIERQFEHEEDFNLMLTSVEDSVQRDILSGLLRIKRDIGDRDLREYLETQRRKTYQRLFG